MIQPKLLKIMDEKQFRKLGEVCDRRVDVRFIAATQQVTLPLVLRKHFRDELQYRVSWTSLSLPPLRERIEDLPVLSAHILGDLAADLGDRQLGTWRGCAASATGLFLAGKYSGT